MYSHMKSIVRWNHNKTNPFSTRFIPMSHEIELFSKSDQWLNRFVFRVDLLTCVNHDQFNQYSSNTTIAKWLNNFILKNILLWWTLLSCYESYAFNSKWVMYSDEFLIEILPYWHHLEYPDQLDVFICKWNRLSNSILMRVIHSWSLFPLSNQNWQSS